MKEGRVSRGNILLWAMLKCGVERCLTMLFEEGVKKGMIALTDGAVYSDDRERGAFALQRMPDRTADRAEFKEAILEFCVEHYQPKELGEKIYEDFFAGKLLPPTCDRPEKVLERAR